MSDARATTSTEATPSSAPIPNPWAAHPPEPKAAPPNVITDRAVNAALGENLVRYPMFHAGQRTSCSCRHTNLAWCTHCTHYRRTRERLLKHLHTGPRTRTARGSEQSSHATMLTAALLKASEAGWNNQFAPAGSAVTIHSRPTLDQICGRTRTWQRGVAHY